VASNAYPRRQGSTLQGDGIEQDASGFILWAGCNAQELDDETLMYASKGVGVKLDKTTCRRTGWSSYIALKLGLESVVECTPQLGSMTLMGG